MIAFFTTRTFLSTLSLRRATLGRVEVESRMWNFYPRSPCGERLVGASQGAFARDYFYPRSPCGERLLGIVSRCAGILFLSTLSLRRATSHAANCQHRSHHFYPRSPCGERQYVYVWYTIVVRFLSTLSLRRATPHSINFMTHMLFLSTLSLRRAT